VHHRVPGLRRSPPRAGLAPTLGPHKYTIGHARALREPRHHPAGSRARLPGHRQLLSPPGRRALRSSRPLTRFTPQVSLAPAHLQANAPCKLRAAQPQPAAVPAVSARSLGARHVPRPAIPPGLRSAAGGWHCRPAPTALVGRCRTVGPNRSLNPRLATAAGVSPVGASGTIVANRAYTVCLRSRG